MDTIKLKRATKSVANASTKVLEKDEVLVVTPDSGSGKGKCQLKFGDGITAAKSLPIAIDGENADEMKVSTIPTDSDENPVLSAGETVKVFFGKIKKKFTYLENLVGNVKSVTNLFGNTDAKTVAQGLQILVNTKLSKTDKYDGVDSTSTELWATANAVRKVNEKTDNNSTSIRELNSNLEWKLNGTYKATDTCPLPEKYNELMIKIYRTSDNAYTCGVNILKAELGKNTGNWMTGCGRDASGWDVKIVIAITNTIAISSVFINAADNKSNFSFAVYYR